MARKKKLQKPTIFGLDAKRESKRVEFKAEFDPSSAQAWCEGLKDIVSIANSGGGVILFGVSKDGKASGSDLSSLLALDPAVIVDKIAQYTGEQFSDFELVEAIRQGKPVAALRIAAATVPLVFVAPGTYDAGGGKQKSAFPKGGIYFRHGAKSEPGTTKDLRDAIERAVARVRRDWLGGIRKVVTAPAGHSVQVLPPEVRLNGSPTAMPVRLVTDTRAPAFRAIPTDELYPYRLTEVVARVRAALPDIVVGQHDVFCVRKVYNVDDQPAFFHKPQFSSPQYSEAFVTWIVEEYKKDATFFARAKTAMKKKE
jgi:hypothetical protein